jgi:outer membrane protein assembly factor BamC
LKQQVFGFTRILPLFLATMILSACSGSPVFNKDGDSILRDKSLDYAQSKVVDRIVVPEGLNDTQVQNDLLTIPTAALIEQSAGIKTAPRPNFVFAEVGSNSAHLTGGANAKRISVTGSLTKVQGQVAQFWSNQDIAIDAASSLNTIETQWFSLSENVPSNSFINRWIRSLTKSDDDIIYGRVKVELRETTTNRIELSLYFLQFTQLEITQNKSLDWPEAGRMLANESEITFELLRYLSRTAQVTQKTDEINLQNQKPLLGKDQHGRPLVQLNMTYEKALPQVLAAMSSFDVGSYDEAAKKVYFTHVSHLRTSEEAVFSAGGVLGWFKRLHSGNARETGINIDLALLGNGEDPDQENDRPIYSSDTQLAVKEVGLADKKGYKIWLGGKVIYVFEDEDQGNISDTGEYTYMGQFQLSFEETLTSVYLQVLNDQAEPAAKVYAEEILWRLQQQLTL